ncbi:hypothetical protein ABZ934_02665 [Streptomyces sp. NPDC046557]|uniref:hypothetical protein n=1 Tax=Streptomyces sp. NPDC046557 TaxID=3155372 RepID=UPI0033EE4C26
MSASRSGRAVGAWGHLLLVVVLALGVFVMHSVGHPDSPSAHPAAHPAAQPAEHAADATVLADPEHGARVAPHAPGMRMDMAALCVAVLGAAILLVLLRAALGRSGLLPARPHPGSAPGLSPRPPPRAPDLTLLSILRI